MSVCVSTCGIICLIRQSICCRKSSMLISSPTHIRFEPIWLFEDTHFGAEAAETSVNEKICWMVEIESWSNKGLFSQLMNWIWIIPCNFLVNCLKLKSGTPMFHNRNQIMPVLSDTGGGVTAGNRFKLQSPGCHVSRSSPFEIPHRRCPWSGLTC